MCTSASISIQLLIVLSDVRIPIPIPIPILIKATIYRLNVEIRMPLNWYGVPNIRNKLKLILIRQINGMEGIIWLYLPVIDVNAA